MINRLLVEGLYDKFNFDLHFHPDLNLLTGRNGSGKTTLMKLMWGMTSQRFAFEASLPNLDALVLETNTEYVLFGNSTRIVNKVSAVADLGFDTQREPYIVGFVEKHNSNHLFIPKRSKEELDFAALFAWAKKKDARSLYFPTFRRNEGGYEFLAVPQFEGSAPESDINLVNMIRAASNGPVSYHTFVNYNSTLDIDFLLGGLISNIAAKTTQLEKEQSEYALKLIGESKDQAEEVLQAVRRSLEETKEKVKQLMRPLDRLSEMIAKLFHGKGVKINDNFSLGDTLNLLHTEHLSSGEKQMLGMIVYSAICKNAVIFIDEPELSLSPDWQRMLVPMLLEVSEGCQFFLATHSPFIYAQYPDKDIFLDNLHKLAHGSPNVSEMLS